MRNTLLASAAALGLALATPAFAQTSQGQSAPPDQNAAPASGTTYPGVGLSEPHSNHASNIDQGDMRSTIAPSLPTPPVSADATPDAYLGVAKRALMAHRTGEAQEALERAETGMLDRSVSPGEASQPDSNPRVSSVQNALHALAHGDRQQADHYITEAMAQPGGSTGMMHGGMMHGMMGGPGATNAGMSSPGNGSMGGPQTPAMPGSATMPNGTPMAPGTSGTTGGSVQP